MTWFETMTGFREISAGQVRDNLTISGPHLTSRVNGRSWKAGELETPSLTQFRQLVAGSRRGEANTSVREIVADVQQLHCDEANTGCVFQVASQFNLLEMVSPDIEPEGGVGIYERDPTQGPACAIAAGAGTIYRNYFVAVGGQVGQSRENQIDCMADVGALLGNLDSRLWRTRNGYILPSHDGLVEVSQRIRESSEAERDTIRQALRIGIQWDTQVTLGGASHTVTQAYCSALPVAYCSHSCDDWEVFATLILEAAYEATICAAIVNAARTGANTLFLTLLGGGAFGNRTEWIIGAISRAIRLFPNSGLDIVIVSYRRSQPSVQRLIVELEEVRHSR